MSKKAPTIEVVIREPQAPTPGRLAAWERFWDSFTKSALSA